MSHHKIIIDNITYHYPGGYEAISELSLKIFHGESVGIIGANGAGKSSLLKLLVGIIKAESGSITIGDVLLTAKTLNGIRQNIGYTFQDANHQLFMNTVYDDVAFAARSMHLEVSQIDFLVKKALETVGAYHLKDKAPYRLSGGEKRAVAIATVIALEPNILILDEPSVALDPKSRRNLIRTLDEFKHTKLIATHDLDMVVDLCERCVVLKDGKIVADGPTKAILTDKKLLESCSLELPLRLQSIEW